MAEEDCFEGLYHFVKVLGEGSFGKAVLYRRYTDNFLVVWKEVKLKSEKEIQAAQHEVDVLSLLSHRNIVGYYNNYVDSDVMYIEMEYANGGTLLHLINNQQQLFSEEEIVWYFYQLCCALAYLHDNGIIHRDIKTVNIFLNKTGILKVGDFGISKMLSSESEAAESIVGTPYYMSPEICRGLSYGYKSDVWSCGCVLYELLELQKTFDATNQLRLVYSIVTKEAKPVSDVWSQPLRDILSSMLKKDPHERPTMKDILTTEYMSRASSVIEGELGPQHYVRGLSQLTPGTQPMLTDLCSEVYIWGGGKTSPQKLNMFKKEVGATKVCVGPKHLCVVTVEKELYTWSSGQPGEIVGQLGHGDKASYRSPKQVSALLGQGVVSVVAGDDFTIAILDSHQLLSFGSNYDGCLGVGEEQENSLVPVHISFFADKRVTSVSCGENHVMAVTDDGHLYGWGSGEYGCLGNDCEDVVYLPQRLDIKGASAVKVECGKHCSFVITNAGKLMASGDNQDNKLGINKIGRKGAKVVKSEETFTFKPVSGLSSVAVRDIACGVDHTAVIDAYDRLWTLGSNKCGQRGLGHYKPYNHPTIVKAKLAGKKIALVSAGDRFTVATTYDNQVYSWGYRNHGRLGDGISNDLGNSNKNSVCIPQAIFSSLHYIPAISSRHWYTLLLAEQVISAQVIGSGEQGLRQYSTDTSKTPTWLRQELELCDESRDESRDMSRGTPAPLGGNKMFHNEISLKRETHASSSGISSAGTSDITTSSFNTSQQSGSSFSTSQQSDLRSPPPIERREFSFDESKYTAFSPDIASPGSPDLLSPDNSGNSSHTNLPTPTPRMSSPEPTTGAISSESSHHQELLDRINSLEQQLDSQKQKVRERDKIIADLEQRLLDFQIKELGSVMK